MEHIEIHIRQLQSLVCNTRTQVYAERIARNLRATEDGRNHPDDPAIRECTAFWWAKFKQALRGEDHLPLDANLKTVYPLVDSTNG